MFDLQKLDLIQANPPPSKNKIHAYARSPLIRLASWISLGMMVTLFAWIAHRLVSSNNPTKYASLASYKTHTQKIKSLFCRVKDTIWDVKSGVSYLQGSNSCTLETQICLEILCNFSDKSLERQLPDEQLSGLLVPTDLTQSNSTRPAKGDIILLQDPFVHKLWNLLILLTGSFVCPYSTCICAASSRPR